jgi:rod shape-determining protein MreD
MSPERVGITTGWIMGLLLDVLSGNLLGAHALGMSLIAFITLNIYQRTRIFPLWQQSLVVFFLISIEHLIQYWVIGITTDITPGLEYWLQPVVGLLLWPWLFILMSEIQHRTEGNL